MPRRIAIATVIALAMSGCGYTGVKLWPRRTVTEVIDQRGVLEVRLSPRGARVVPAAGEAGLAPYHHETTYQVTTSYRRYSRWGLVVGALLSLAAGAGLIAWAFEDDTAAGPKVLGGSLLLSSGALDLAFSGFIVDGLNRRARLGREVTVTPREVELDVAWEDFTPVHLTVSIPTERIVVVRRPVTVDFEQGLIHWARTSGRELTGDALFAVGRAYARRARAGGAEADRAAAIDHLQRFLAIADPAAPTSTEARALLEELQP